MPPLELFVLLLAIALASFLALRGSKRRGERAASVEWARRVLADPRGFAILDTETTGLETDDEVIQIAAIDSAGVELFSCLVNPANRASIPADATKIHGLKIQDLRKAPSWPEVSATIAEQLRGRTIVTYNAAYDLRLVDQTTKRNGGADLTGRWECAMLAYAQYIGEPNPKKPGQYRWHKLPSGDHSALGDCRAALEVIRTIARRGPKLESKK